MNDPQAEIKTLVDDLKSIKKQILDLTRQWECLTNEQMLTPGMIQAFSDKLLKLEKQQQDQKQDWGVIKNLYERIEKINKDLNSVYEVLNIILTRLGV